MSWDDIPNEETILKHRQLKLLDKPNKEFYSLAYSIFECTDQGKKFLNLLREKYLMAPVCLPDKPASYGYFREGENRMVRNIMGAIENHKKLMEKGEKDD